MAKGDATKAIIVDSIRSEPGQAPGAIEFRHYQSDPEAEIAGLACRCPCGCGAEMWLPVRMIGTPRIGRPEWEWNGKREAVILQPSVFNTGLPCRWHGYLGGSDRTRPGEWIEV